MKNRFFTRKFVLAAAQSLQATERAMVISMVEYNKQGRLMIEKYGQYSYKCSAKLTKKWNIIAKRNNISLKHAVTFAFYYVLSCYYTIDADAIQLLMNIDQKRIHLNSRIDTDLTLDYYLKFMQMIYCSATEYYEEPLNNTVSTLVTDGRNIQNNYSYDLIVEMLFVNDKMTMNIYFNRNIYELYMIRSIMESFTKFLSEAAWDKQIRNITILSTKAYNRILNLYNNCRSKERSNIKYNPNWLYYSAVKYGSKAALITEMEKVSYLELYDQVKKIAWSIIQNGVNENDVIAVMMPRTVELVISILGALHAGAICTVIDKEFPTNRAQTMLEMSRARFLLVRDEEDYKWAANTSVLSYKLLQERSSEIGDINIPQQSEMSFIVFTSGSTGRPKGIELNNIGIFNHIQTKIDEGRLTEEDVFCYNLGVSFVASIWLILTPLMIGASLYIMGDKEIKNPSVFFEKIIRNHITVLELIPSYLNTYLQISGGQDLKRSSLRIIFLTGEVLHKSIVKRFYENNKIQLINAYGQSECSDDTLHYHVPYNIDSKYIPIGHPAIQTRAYILNQQMQLQPPGFAGDIYIAGESIAQYYKGKEISLKTLKYEELEDKVYQTGDIGFWDTDGNIVFLGRKDRMVKVNGCRIDLQEVENAALQLNYIQKAAAIVNDDNRLLLFVVSIKETDETNILKDISNGVPAYMVPHQVRIIKSLPLNKNGKIDYKKLDILDKEVEIKLKSENILEDRVLQIYVSVCKKSIDIEDNLLFHTADSLMFAVFISKINSEFNIQLTLEEIIDNPSIRRICEFICKKK